MYSTQTAKVGKLFFSLIFIFLLLSFCVENVGAQVVINEFSSWEPSGDWIELYAFEDVDISGWILRDTATSIMKTIPGSTTIGPSSNLFYVVEVGNRLNKDGDTIRLLKSDDLTFVDQVSYGSDGGVCAPLSGQSVGRYPDANSVVERFKTNTTKGVSNNTVELDPCPSPTLAATPTNTSTPSPKPTKAPTETPTTKPTKTLTPTTKTNLVTPTISINGEGDTSDNKVFENENEQTGVLGIQQTSSRNVSPTPSLEEEDNKKRFPVIAWIFIVSGIGISGVALYPIFRKKRLGYNLKDEEIN